MSAPDNVEQIRPADRPSPAGSGNGGASHGERLARIEAHLEHTAKREDVSEIKALIERKESTMLRWLVGVIAVAAISLLAALLRTFISP